MGIDALPPQALRPTEPGSAGQESLRAGAPRKDAKNGRAGAAGSGSETDSLQLSPEARAEVAKLQARDQEVRAHEQAHISAGGSLVRSGPSFTFQTGPDGRRYAVGGEVSLDASGVEGDPRATRLKAQRLRAAALAPANPSPQDHAVAASATRMEAEASAAISRESAEALQEQPATTAPGPGDAAKRAASAPLEPRAGSRVPSYGVSRRPDASLGGLLDSLA